MSEKALKEHIVSFRVSHERATVVERMLNTHRIVSVKSIHQFFRKIGLDYLEGRLIYKNPEDATRDTDLHY